MLKLLVLFLFSTSSPDITSLEIQTGNEQHIPDIYFTRDEFQGIEIGESYWVKVEITFPEEGNYILSGGNWYMRDLTFFDPNKNQIGYGHFSKIKGSKGQSAFYIYYPFPDEKDKNSFSPIIEKELQYFERFYSVQTKQIVFQSILIFIILVSIFFGLSSRERVYLYYALYLFFLGCFFAYQYGLLGSIIPAVDEIPMMWIWLFGFTITLFYMLFSERFLDVKNKDPFAYKWWQFGIGYIFLLSLSSISLYALEIDVQHNHWYKTPMLIIEVIFLLVYLYRVARFQGTVKNYFLLSSFILFIVSIGGQINSTLQLTYDFNNFAQPALIGEIFILCLGLGVRVYQIQKSKDEYQQKLIVHLKEKETLQRDYARQLEQKVTERTALLEDRNKENVLLLKEIHHRVKNNLQMITSLINMQERRVSVETKDAFKATRNKIKSIALIHEHLYKNERLSSLNLKKYVAELIEMLIGYNQSTNPIKVKLKICDIAVSFEEAIQIGILVNELVTNSIKYAFRDHEFPEIIIEIDINDGIISIDVMDNGNGQPENVSNNGLGFKIVNAITSSFDGDYKILRKENCFCVSVTLNLRSANEYKYA